MKVSKLIELLKVEDQTAEVIAYVVAEDGWEMVAFGMGNAIIGKVRTGKKSFVLVPVEVPENSNLGQRETLTGNLEE